jgi:thiol-disulfide isomerase/thioredoxin
MYRRIPKELTESSWLGVVFSIISSIVIIFLMVSEIWSFVTPEITSSAVVDYNSDNVMYINLNITMTQIPCEFATVNVIDSLGRREYNVSTGLRKYRTDAFGNRARRTYTAQETREEELRHDEHHDLEALYSNGEHNIDLDSHHFHGWIANNKYVFVNFHTKAETCEWCQKLAPVWEALAEEVYAEQLDASIVSLNCDNDPAFCAEQRVMAFPTLRMYKSGAYNPPEYTYDRTVAAMMTFVRSKVSSDEDESDPRFKMFRRKTNALVGGFYTGNEDDKDSVGCNLVGSLKVNR